MKRKRWERKKKGEKKREKMNKEKNQKDKREKVVEFSLALFNGISIYLGYLMPKLSS